MELPDFNEFLLCLTPDVIGGIMKDAKAAAVASYETRPGDNALACHAIAYQTALGLLAFYHRWLANDGEIGTT